MTGIVVLVIAVAVTVVAAVVIRRRNGRFAPVSAGPDPAVPDSAGPDHTASQPSERLTAETIGAPLGDVATLVQFSSAFCTPCRATRALLTDIASRTDGVETVEIDAESHLELVRELNIMRTPTVLVLDADGVVTTRASGQPRRDQVMAAIDVATCGRSTI